MGELALLLPKYELIEAERRGPMKEGTRLFILSRMRVLPASGEACLRSRRRSIADSSLPQKRNCLDLDSFCTRQFLCMFVVRNAYIVKHFGCNKHIVKHIGCPVPV
jgi:hypothetical protein